MISQPSLGRIWRPHPALLAWLDGEPEGVRHRALVIGCGLGDDAEAVRRRGYRVSAFDIAPTAIARCRQRFPDSKVGLVYRRD